MIRRLLSLCALLAACSGDEAELFPENPLLLGISFAPMWSAFGGTHNYAVTPSMPSVANPPNDPSTLRWHVDEKLATIEPFDALPAAIKVTMRGAGSADLEVTGTYFGNEFGTRARIHITEASDEDWERGEARFHSGPQADLETLRQRIDGLGLDADSGSGECGALDSKPSLLPKDSACSGCHAEDAGILLTPSQLAGTSDGNLITTFTQGRLSDVGTYTSDLLINRPCADSIFKAFHSFSMNEEEELGVLIKLRSLTPQLR